MADSCVLLSGFSDEAAPDKTPDQQFSVMAALGLQYVSLRFLDCGSGIRNVLDLNPGEFRLLRRQLAQFGLSVSSIGSPIGKVRIADIDDGTANRYVPFQAYLGTEVPRALDAAEALECRLVRGFSFYHPKNQPVQPWLRQAVDQLGQIAEMCAQRGLTFGLEIEANLIGHTGQILRDIHATINSPALVLVFDGGNLVTQGYSTDQILEQFRVMLPGLGWMHVKDHARASGPASGTWVDEERLDRFVPADQGAAGHLAIFEELRGNLPGIVQRLKQRRVPGFFVDLEPHLRGGGQFGGYSGPDGMGIACRALCHVLQSAGLSFRLRDEHDIEDGSC